MGDGMVCKTVMYFWCTRHCERILYGPQQNYDIIAYVGVVNTREK